MTVSYRCEAYRERVNTALLVVYAVALVIVLGCVLTDVKAYGLVQLLLVAAALVFVVVPMLRLVEVMRIN